MVEALSTNMSSLTTSLQERSLFRLTYFSEREIYSPRLVIATDFEGPLVLHDAAARVMSIKVRPEDIKASSPDYGNILYNATYDWYTKRTLLRRRTDGNKRPFGVKSLFAQEGTDISFAMAPLLAMGTNQAFINEVAMQYKMTPGAKELIKYLKGKNSLIVAVTTAWEEPHQLIGKEIGIDSVVGSPFPIDQTKELLKAAGRWDEEIDLTRKYLNDCFLIIDQIENSQGAERELYKQKLHERIETFYEDELGISYDPLVRAVRKDYKTLLGQVIENIGAVGDRAKAAVALSLFRRFKNSSISVSVGDGLNDSIMLAKNDLSIGLNGPDAAKAAKIGIVTPDVQNLIPVYALLQENPGISIEDLVRESRRLVDNKTIIHEGGLNIPDWIIQEHRQMKKALRGEVIV